MSEQTIDLLGDCLEKFRYLMYLPEDYDQTLLHEVEDQAPAIVSSLMKDLWKFEEASDVIRHNMENVESLDTHSNLCIIVDLDSAIRELSRELKSQIQIQHLLTKDKQPINQGATRFLILFDQYIQGVKKRLNESQEEIFNRRNEENKLYKSILSNEAQQKTLEVEYKTQSEKHKKELDSIQATIDNLMTKLGDLKANYEKNMKKMKEGTEKQTIEETTNHTTKKTTEETKQSELNKQYEKQNRDNKTTHDPMTKTRARLRNELAELLDKYDKDVGYWDFRIKELEAEHNKELKELAVLSEYFRKIDDENARIQAEEDHIKAEQTKISDYMIILGNSAIGLQRIYRGFAARKFVKALKAKLKKKRRKGKKKGKKK